ncbi:rod shape-determining protein MreC [Acidithrix sp. C25]|uniref:rod shape-determining protein MreC n=1 Tax=Acidithrix sp. C25 TaxID=1671482 RepID=UPI00191BB13D|nr:rod shape-determining protein MreC [Acidithrix sp. C25]
MATQIFRRPRITLVILILVSISLISVSYKKTPPFITGARGYVRDIVTPIRQGATALVTPIYNTIIGAFDYSSLKATNQKLVNEIALIRNQRVVDAGAARSLAQLSKQLKIPYVGNIPSTPAQVISVTPTNLQMSVEIDKGTSDGVAIGNPVVSNLGLVGRIIQVSPSSSTVLLLNDPNFSVGVRFGSASQLGLVVGQGGGQKLSVQLVDPGTVLPVGTFMYTSGLSGEIFPAGIPVGSVYKAFTPPGGLQEHVELTPLASLSNLNYVSVLHWLPGVKLP